LNKRAHRFPRNQKEKKITKEDKRRPYWPKVAWVGLALCALAVFINSFWCYCPGYYLFWAAICCGVFFVGRRWCSGLALVVLVFALAYSVRDYRALQKEQAHLREFRKHFPPASPTP
jgi:membrane protein implicated in regulation of membrane protease activity